MVIALALLVFMPLIFPNLPPHYLKSITMPSYNTLTREFPDGGEARIQTSTIGAGTGLLLSYNNLSETNTASIMTFYASCKGEAFSFLLPSSIINHPQVIKDAIALLKATTWWLFDGQVSINPVFATDTRGIYDVDVKIKSTVS